MPEIGTSGMMIVLLEKGQCDSHKIEIKNVGTRFNFNFSRYVPCERSAPRLPCASNGRRSSYRRAYTYQPAFLYCGARSADTFLAPDPPCRACGASAAWVSDS